MAFLVVFKPLLRVLARPANVKAGQSWIGGRIRFGELLIFPNGLVQLDNVDVCILFHGFSEAG